IQGRKPTTQKASEVASWVVGMGQRLLLGVLLGLGLGVELRRVAVLDGDAQRLFQEAAGLATIGAGVALGLHGGLGLRRDSGLDNASHQGSSRWVISRSTRARERCSSSTRWKALRKRVIQRARAARSLARFSCSRRRRTCVRRSGAGVAEGVRMRRRRGWV